MSWNLRGRRRRGLVWTCVKILRGSYQDGGKLSEGGGCGPIGISPGGRGRFIARMSIFWKGEKAVSVWNAGGSVGRGGGCLR